MHNYHKQDLASVPWLTTHFFAKSPQRFRQFSALPIFPGNRVLDLCCGPGLYTRYIADLVGAKGHVTGLDHDPLSLDAAHKYLSAFPFKNWDLVHADLRSFYSSVGNYDVILLMNCIGYFDEPDAVINNIASKAKPGTAIIVKDFDLGSVFFTPMPSNRFAALIHAAKMNNDKSNPLKFDNFFGRKVPFLHRSFNFTHHSHDIWTQSMCYPFSDYEIEYIWRNIEALLLQARPTCDGDTVEYFTTQFCQPQKPFFDNRDGLFLENEYIAILIT